jgi:hypothetical protein
MTLGRYHGRLLDWVVEAKCRIFEQRFLSSTEYKILHLVPAKAEGRQIVLT